jgi:hypothetical protein
MTKINLDLLNSVDTINNVLTSRTQKIWHYSNAYDFFTNKENQKSKFFQSLSNLDNRVLTFEKMLTNLNKNDFVEQKSKDIEMAKVRHTLQDILSKLSNVVVKKDTNKELSLQTLQTIKIFITIFCSGTPKQISDSVLKQLSNIK